MEILRIRFEQSFHDEIRKYAYPVARCFVPLFTLTVFSLNNEEKMAMNSSQEGEKLSPEHKFSIIAIYGPMIYGPTPSHLPS